MGRRTFKPRNKKKCLKLSVQDEDKLDTDSDKFRAALHNLNEALKEENIKAIKSLTRPGKEGEHREPSFSEDHIIVCVGNHLISNLAGLAGKAVTSKAKSRLPCPCGCQKTLLAEGCTLVETPPYINDMFNQRIFDENMPLL